MYGTSVDIIVSKFSAVGSSLRFRIQKYSSCAGKNITICGKKSRYVEVSLILFMLTITTAVLRPSRY